MVPLTKGARLKDVLHKVESQSHQMVNYEDSANSGLSFVDVSYMRRYCELLHNVARKALIVTFR